MLIWEMGISNDVNIGGYLLQAAVWSEQLLRHLGLNLRIWSGKQGHKTTMEFTRFLLSIRSYMGFLDLEKYEN